MLTPERITSISRQAGEPKELLEARLRALEACLALPSPSLKYGRATSFAPASVSLPLDASSAPAAAAQHIAAADGIRVLSYAEAMADAALAAVLRQRSLAPLDGADKIDAWHDAVCSERRVIHATATAPEPIAIEWQATGDFAASELCIIAEEGVQATFAETAAAGTARFASRRVTLVAKAGASIDYRAAVGAPAAQSCALRQIGHAERSARITFANAVLAGDYVRLRTACTLAEEGADAAARVAYAAAGSEKRDLYTSIAHRAPRTTAAIGSRGIVSGSAKAVARDLLAIGQGMVGCEARQIAKALTLSDAAEAHVAPLLEIATDDVRCSHSASVGRLDEEQLFFLMSRGLSRADAATALVEAFMDGDFSLTDEGRSALAQRLLNDSSYGN